MSRRSAGPADQAGGGGRSSRRLSGRRAPADDDLAWFVSLRATPAGGSHGTATAGPATGSGGPAAERAATPAGGGSRHVAPATGSGGPAAERAAAVDTTATVRDRPAAGQPATRARLRIDPIRCDGHGLCADLVPELLRLDDWGYPMPIGADVPRRLESQVGRAAKLCPTLAIVVEKHRRRG